MAQLEELRAHPKIVALRGQHVDQSMTKQEQAEIGQAIPAEWFEDGAAVVGTAEECARNLHAFLDAGADELIIHGSTPDLLAPVAEAFTKVAVSRTAG
jgi:alkanesulfonate monooxygenase SsuD/methylene tetrahydromethanopterin reductase-like flavin-dependent oxidoreductase (luciferase family)